MLEGGSGDVTVSAVAPMSLASSDALEKTTGPPIEAAIESVTATGHVSEPATGGAAHIGRFCSAAGASVVCARPTPDAETTAYTSRLVTATFRSAGGKAPRGGEFFFPPPRTKETPAAAPNPPPPGP